MNNPQNFQTPPFAIITMTSPPNAPFHDNIHHAINADIVPFHNPAPFLTPEQPIGNTINNGIYFPLFTGSPPLAPKKRSRIPDVERNPLTQRRLLDLTALHN